MTVVPRLRAVRQAAARRRNGSHRASPEAPERSGEGHSAHSRRDRRRAGIHQVGPLGPHPGGRPHAARRPGRRPCRRAARAGRSPDVARRHPRRARPCARLARKRATMAQKRLDRALAPAKPSDISAAQAEVKKAEADQALLGKTPATPLPEEISAAQFAVTVAQQNLAAAQAASPTRSCRHRRRPARADQGRRGTRGAQPSAYGGDHVCTGGGGCRARQAGGAPDASRCR